MIKTGWRVTRALVVTIGAVPMIAACAAPVTASSPPPPARPASPQVMVAGTPRTIDITVSGRDVSMPSTLKAGTYVFRVRTTDKHATVQAFRPGAGLTLRQFIARGTGWKAAYNGNGDPRVPFHTFVKSGYFLGGATATPDTLGMFAQTLSAGTYWFYENAYSVPTHVAKTKIVTVTGALPAPHPMPIAGDVTYRDLNVLLPARLPGTGWLRISGSSPQWHSWILRQISPTAPDAACSGLDYEPVCAFDLISLDNAIGAPVSPGQSVLWHYDLPPGKYVIADFAPGPYFDTGLGDLPGDPGVATPFTVS